MAKIKDPKITFAPNWRVPGIGIEQKGVAKASPPRAIPSGKRILAQAYGELGAAVGDVAKYTMMREIGTRDSVDSVEASDRLADLKNDLNQHYINNIAPLRGSRAKDVFKHEIETMAGMKDIFLKEVEGNKRLHDFLSVQFDKETQDHLQKVFKHKLTQDAVYARDTALKVAKNLQSEMSTLTLNESSKAIDISNQMNEQLAEYPELREAAKITAWKGMFKFNARANPELTQTAYENETMRKSIVKQIGFEGYSVIQEAIDKGRAIGIQDRALEKQQTKEEEDIRVDNIMNEAMHLFFQDIIQKTTKFDANYVDKLGTEQHLPDDEQRILNGLLASITKKKLSAAEVDWPTYDELLEDVRLVKLTKEKASDIRNKIIPNINRLITTEQGQSLLKMLANRDVFDTPIIQDAFATLKESYQQGKLEGPEYSAMIRGLTDTVIQHDGKAQKVQEYVQDVIDPSVRKSDWRRVWESITPEWLVTPQPEFGYVQPRLTTYMSEEEIKNVNEILFTQPDKNGVIRTVDQIPDEILQQYLDYVRSPKYIEDQEKRK